MARFDLSNPRFDDAVVAMMLQRHRAAETARTVTGASCRIIQVLIALIFTIVARIDLTRFLALLVVSAIVTIVWTFRERGYALTGQSIEDIISRMTGGAIEDVYIETRRVTSESFLLLRFSMWEPLLWMSANGAVGILVYWHGR